MSEVYIHYGNLEDSIAQSKKVRSEISGYVEEIKRRVTTPISNLSGSDSSGYASTASSLAWQKISDLNAKASRYSSYESSISTLVSTAKTKDNYVSSQIETISDLYLTERNWFQKAGDAIYNFFCVDLVNKWGWTRTISDAAKWVGDKIDNVTDKISDWFKYGDGKYLANIGGALLGAVAAVAGVIVAIVTLPVTGTAAMIIGLVSLVAATVGMIITLVNTESTIKGNIKAWQLREEHPGAARYYGNIKSLSDEWDKTDMGDASANKAYDIAGDVIDATKVVADTAQFVCNILNLGVVKDFRFKEGHGNANHLDFSWNNIKRNILHDMNIYTSKVGKNGVKWYETVNWEDAIDAKKWFGGYSSGKFKIDGKFVIPEGLFKVFNITKIVKNTTDTFENFSDIGEALSADEFKLGDLLKPIGDLTSIFSPVEKPVEYVTDTTDTIKDWRDWFKGAFDSPEEIDDWRDWFDGSKELDKETIQGWFEDAFEGTVLEPTPAVGRF